VLFTYNLDTQCVPCIVYIYITFNQQIHKEFVNAYLFIHAQQTRIINKCKKKNKNAQGVTYIENRHLVQQHKYSETTST
jgi:hypothetical protein